MSKKERVISYSISILLALAIIMNATFIWPGLDRHPDFDNMFVTALVVAVFPPSVLDLLDRRWRSAVDAKLPDLIRDIAESQKTGMSFTKAIEHSARLSYGPLTNELRKTVALLTWGTPYDEALNDLARRIDTPMAYRTMVMLNEVGHSGGRLYEILDSVYSHIREVQDLERDRRRQMTPYVMVIYASFGVYFFVVVVLFTTFFSQIGRLVSSGAPFGANINPDLFYIWFFHMSIIEALMGGFVAGKMGEGVMSAGLKHVLILLIASLMVFIFVILPTIR